MSSISEKIGQITAVNNLQTKPHLRKNNRIKSIHSSLKIEANSLVFRPGQRSDQWQTCIRRTGKKYRRLKNAYAAYEQLAKIHPYDINDLKKFHNIMTKYVVEESGDFRHGEEGVFNGEQCIFHGASGTTGSQLINELFFLDERISWKCSSIDFEQRVSL